MKKALLLCLLLCSCKPASKPSPKKLGGTSTPKTYTLEWQYATCPAPSVVTEVFTNDGTFTFYLMTVTADTNLTLGACSAGSLFFRVRARDLSTGLTSTWGTTSN